MQVEEAGSGLSEYTSTRESYTRAFFNDVDITACALYRGNALAKAPLYVWTRLANGKRQKVDHDASGVLASTNPKNWYTGHQWHRWNLISLDIHGHAASQVATNRLGIPTELYWFPPTAYTPYPDDNGYLGGIRWRESGGQEHVVPASQLFYLATGSITGDLGGMSRIQSLRMDLNLTAYSKASNYWFFRNNQRPDWLLTGDFAPTADNVEGLRRQIQKWAGGDNRRGPLILGGGNISAHLMTTERKDMEWLSQQRLSQEAKASAFGVPVFFLNNLDRATYANYDTALKAWWHDTLIPQFDDYADQLTRNFLWRWPDARSKNLFMAYDYGEIAGIAEDFGKIWEREVAMAKIMAEAMIQRGLTPNQWRMIQADAFDRLGLDSKPFKGEVPQGDDILTAWSNIPASQADANTVLNAMLGRGPNAAYLQNIPNNPTDWEAVAQRVSDDLAADRRQAQDANQQADQQARQAAAFRRGFRRKIAA